MLSDRVRLSCLLVCLYSLTLVYCDQTVGWIKMKLGTEVGLGPGNVRWGPSSQNGKGHSPPPHFRPTALARSAISATAEHFF